MATASFAINANLNAVATVNGYFSPIECERIIALGSARAATGATVSAARLRPTEATAALRKTTVTWLQRDASTTDLFFKIERIAQDINKQFYKFELAGFGDPIQFTRYEKTGDYYTWHQDLGGGQMSLRKLSLVVQLSDPETYRGCDLQLYSDGEPTGMARSQGTILIFPSWHLHRVTPLEEGVRYSLVTWIAGPPFR
jgi:PKHD-type hydroxylase